MSKLTQPQFDLLVEVERGQSIGLHCDTRYKPAIKLVSLGLARWRNDNYLVITEAGIAHLTGSTP